MDASDTFDVVILGFDERDELPEARLTRAFGIETETARQLVAALPVTVQRAVSRVRAEYYLRALALIGARADVRDRDGRSVGELPQPAAAPAYADRGRIDPMSDTLAMVAAPTHMPEAVAPEPPAPASSPWLAPSAPPSGAISATLREAQAPELQHGAESPARRPSPRVAQPATLFDVNPRLGAPARAPDREGDAVMAAAPTAYGEAAPAWAPIELAGRVEPAAGPIGASVRPAAATVAAGAWTWDMELPGARQGAEPDPARQGAEPEHAQEPAWAPRLPSSVFDPPASDPRPENRAGLMPRDPSSVFDPPPGAPLAPALPARPAREPRAERERAHEMASAPLPEFGFVAIQEDAPQAAQALDLAEPPPGITLDADPGADLRVLAPWEQPRKQSMQDPDAIPARRERRARPERAAVAGPAAAGPAQAAAAAAGPARAARPKPRPPGPAPAADRPPPAARPPRAAHGRQPAAAAGVADRRATAKSLANADMRTFWAALVDAMILPFTGPGLYWIGAITALSVAVGVLGIFATVVPILGAVVMFFANTCVLAFACDYYRVCMWAPLSGDKTPDRAPEFDPTRVMNVYVKSGLHLSLFMLLSQVALLAWVGYHFAQHGLQGVLEALLDPITWLLVLLPYYYWPMGVGLTALSNNFAAIWNLPAGLAAIGRAPLEYTLVVGIGIATLFGSIIFMAIFGSMLGIAGDVASGAIGLPLAISHGVQGALMGHLARARPEIFEE